MLSSHPSPDALDRYRRGLLPPEKLLAVDDHLAACETCRAAALGAAPAAPTASNTVNALAGASADDHPEFEALAAFVDGTQDDVAREVMEMHLADCTSCRDEVADLRAFKARLPVSAAPVGDVAPGGGRSRLWMAFALPAAAVIVWMLISRGAVVRQVAPGPAPADRPSARIEPGGNPKAGQGPPDDPSAGKPPVPPAAATVATLRDGGSVITLDAAGDLTGLPSSVQPPERTLLVAALSTGRMPLPELIRDLAAEGEVLRGSGGTAAGGASLPFALLEPLGTAVESDRPRFRWERVASARAYVVTVYDEDFTRVARSPELTSPEWTCDQLLTRGSSYNWQVSAITGGATVTAPIAPAPAARFVVLTEAEAGGLARLRQQHANAHLVMAAAYARAGVRDAAERELRALQRDNPDAAIIRNLLASLR